MLVEYQKQHQLIAMDLLAHLVSEGESAEALQEELAAYEELPEAHLYLWKQCGEFIGIIGIMEHNQTFTVHRAYVIPSSYNLEADFLMVQEVQQMQEPLPMCSTARTKDFLGRCWRKQFPSLQDKGRNQRI